jgi:predicted NBD/HSP70 family sugar kinase
VLQKLGVNTLQEAQALFESGNARAGQVVRDAAHYLGVSLAGLIGTLNIRRIVISGDMACFGEPWLNIVKSSMRNAALTRLAEDTQLELGNLQYRACILGASAFLLLDGYSILFLQEI